LHHRTIQNYLFIFSGCEEYCNYEEARELYENERKGETVQEFWKRYSDLHVVTDAPASAPPPNSFKSEPESEDSVGIELDVANHWVDFNKTAGRRTNTNSQQRFFSGDLSMEFAPQTGKKLNWGGVAEIPTVPMAQIYYSN